MLGGPHTRGHSQPRAHLGLQVPRVTQGMGSPPWHCQPCIHPSPQVLRVTRRSQGHPQVPRVTLSPHGRGPPARLPGPALPPGAPAAGCGSRALRPWGGGSPAGRGHRGDTHLPDTSERPPVGSGPAAPYLGGVEGGVVRAVDAPVGAQLQQVEQDVAAQQVGDGEAQGDPADGAGAFVVELREDGGMVPSTGGDTRQGTEGTSLSTRGCRVLPHRRAPP